MYSNTQNTDHYQKGKSTHKLYKQETGNMNRLPLFIVNRINMIVSFLKSGNSHHDLRGKKLKVCRKFSQKRCVSIPLQSGYRAIFEWCKDGYNLLWYGTHQKYDKVLTQP